ncbi:hypothetical protein GQX73_g6159 [Xylaria multiplex]|uniref:DUF8212 domain-containing protein n=1 Tax=Xylaria multiplex TaxID=323545 RepID=A0A7C8MWN0_9PEZI|nr:hypothetical protein GQX73_g6159 [Xylaria multiplex]
MFRWYQDAAICYAHLVDVSDDLDRDSLLPALSRSRWFTRGWTLQELLAPRDIVFFSENWQNLTTKLESVEILSSITGIEEGYLKGDPIEDASAAKRMSWAANRETTRMEDAAYCLLGIFDVNMPLIYGEGKKAFKRLQEEIIKANPEDHTLFAWGELVEKMTDIPYLIADQEKAAEMDEIPWEASKVTQPLSGLLAESPSDFKNSGGFMTSGIASKFYKYAPRGIITSLPQIQDAGIRLQLPVRYNQYQSIYYWRQPQIATLHKIGVAVLLCCHKKAPSFLPAILLRGSSEKGSSYNRTREICIRYTPLPQALSPPMFKNRQMLSIRPQRPLGIESGDIMLRRYICGKNTTAMGWFLEKAQSIPEGLIKMRGAKNGLICILYDRICQVTCRHGFGIKLERIEKDNEDMAGISAGLLPVDSGSRGRTKLVPIKPDFGLKWHPRDLGSRCNMPPTLEKIVNMPSDTVVFDILPFPVITIKAERVRLNVKGSAKDSFVDVLDIVITERMSPSCLKDQHNNTYDQAR